MASQIEVGSEISVVEQTDLPVQQQILTALITEGQEDNLEVLIMVKEVLVTVKAVTIAANPMDNKEEVTLVDNKEVTLVDQDSVAAVKEAITQAVNSPEEERRLVNNFTGKAKVSMAKEVLPKLPVEVEDITGTVEDNRVLVTEGTVEVLVTVEDSTTEGSTEEHLTAFAAVVLTEADTILTHTDSEWDHRQATILPEG